MKEEDKNIKGTYSGGKFSKLVLEQLKKFYIKNNIPNKNKNLHVTILFSRKNLPDYKAPGKVSYSAKASNFHVFEEKTKVLVLLLDSKELKKRHKELMDKHNGTYDFPEYIPHITLSYDIGDYDWESLNIEYLSDIDFTVEEEYQKNISLLN